VDEQQNHLDRVVSVCLTGGRRLRLRASSEVGWRTRASPACLHGALTLHPAPGKVVLVGQVLDFHFSEGYKFRAVVVAVRPSKLGDRVEYRSTGVVEGDDEPEDRRGATASQRGASPVSRRTSGGLRAVAAPPAAAFGMVPPLPQVRGRRGAGG